MHTGADLARARVLLGYAPSTTLDDGLGAEFEWTLARAAGRAVLVG
jgi:nucleoside-diphosphate-sugar epimerase